MEYSLWLTMPVIEAAAKRTRAEKWNQSSAVIQPLSRLVGWIDGWDQLFNEALSGA